MSYEVQEKPYNSGKYIIVNTGRTIWLKELVAFNRFRSLKAAKRYKKGKEQNR